MMRRKGFEPSRPNGHMRLKHACLPFHHLRKRYNYYTPSLKKMQALSFSPFMGERWRCLKFAIPR